MTCLNSLLLLSPEIEIDVLDEKYAPRQGSDMAAGFDLRAMLADGQSSVTINPGDMVKVSAGFRLNMLTKDVAFFAIPRSGTGTLGLHLANVIGLIDADYQGEVFLVIRNVSQGPLVINDGDRVAQGVFMPVVHPVFKRVKEFSTITERGNGGFGSTGTK
ncbi:hypothetical protein ATN89_17125 [Comamonas thiooxydans]|uniref:dUTP diphosphatase n=1 Tax=Comamonas thiooxydans TaxID=363952 RepID=UPI0007C503AC|nr:dUTP diphosphatase [Comamonas thiooxydans]OAD82940.1 hypothetical protein ATN89_17125 [Comamonas thiooxydans]